MHSSPILHLALFARGFTARRPWLARTPRKSRQRIGIALIVLLAIAACEPARSQNAEPKAGQPAAGPADPTGSPPAAQSPYASVPVPDDEVRAYLWSVYQRSPVKADGHGDFTWKDFSAAGRAGLSLEEYVIGGIDPDYREVLFAAGHAMDAAGIEWTILSGFRDDFRQKLASGLKARVDNSFHGGSVATGGYRHGCAVDLASADRLADDKVWRWVDRNGRDFALHRPLRAADPAHIIPLAGWHELGAMLRNKRLGITADPDVVPTLLGDLVTVEQYLCVRPLPPEPAAAAAGGTDTGPHAAANWTASHAARHDAKGNGAPPKPNGVTNGVRETQATRPARTTQAASGPPREDRPRSQ
jgi:hypothetical protein